MATHETDAECTAGSVRTGPSASSAQIPSVVSKYQPKIRLQIMWSQVPVRVDSAEVMCLLRRCCPARPKPHMGPSAPQNLPALWRNKSAFQIRLLTRSTCGSSCFWPRGCARGVRVAARCWVSPRTEPSGDLSRLLQQNRCRQTRK